MTLSMTKAEEPTGAFSETSYILKTNDESLSFTELLPKLGLSASSFGLPSIQNLGNSGGSHSHSSSSVTRAKPSIGSNSAIGNGPIYKVASPTEYYNPASQSQTFHSSLSHYAPTGQHVSVKSPLSTTINGDVTVVQNSNAGKSSFLANTRPSSSSSSAFHKLPNYHFGSYTSHSSLSASKNPSPTGVIEEIVIGKPTGNLRPSLPESQEYSYSESTFGDDHRFHESSSLAHSPSYSSLSSSEHSDKIHSSQSDHKFGHITTNYYIPHTIHSESEYKKKPFTPSPQVEYFVPQDAQGEHHVDPFRNHYVPSDEAQQQHEIEQYEYQTESSKTEDYFLPRVNPAYSTPSPVVAPAPSVMNAHHKVVYQENPSFTSYFKFGTQVEEQGNGNPATSNKGNPRPHLFPRTESKVSFGAQFKPNPETSFSAHPTPTMNEEKASATYYTIKEEPLDYNPYKSAPIALLKPQYLNHDVTNYDQIHRDFVSKHQNSGIQKATPSILHREFSTKVDAENYVKNTILGSATSDKRPNKFKFLPTLAPQVQQETTSTEAENYPPSVQYVYEVPSSAPVEHYRPVVESSAEQPHYSLPDAPNFDNAHLDLGLGSDTDDGSFLEPTRRSILRPSMALKETIASKQTISGNNADTASTSSLQTTADTISATTANTNFNSAATNDNNQSSNPPPNNNPSTDRPNNSPHPNNNRAPSPQPPTPNYNQKARPANHRRRQPNPNNHRNKSTLSQSSSTQTHSSAKEQSIEPLSEKTSTQQQDYQQGAEQHKKRLSPRQKIISCERQCIRNNAGQEYDPVCGSDGKTYSNKSKLRCTKKCGKSGKNYN